MKKRIEKISAWLKRQNADLAFIHSPHSVFYLSGFMCNPHERLMGIFVFPEANPLLVCPRLEEENARQSGWAHQILAYDDAENPWERIREQLVRCSVGEGAVVAVEKDHLSVARAEQLQQVIPRMELCPVDEYLNELRVLKDETEIAILQKAAKLADEAVAVGIDALKPGITEMEVVAEIELAMKKKGVQAMSFATTVLFGEKSALPHGTPGLRPLKRGELVLFDLGVVVDGYCSDITRTVAFGPIDEKQKEIYHTVLEAETAAIAACKPGVRLGDLDLVARRVIEEAGYGQYFTHRLGHGLGIDVHEFPSIHQANDQVLQAGMVFTIEPGIYLPGSGGVRIEDDVVITEEGCQVLTHYPKELIQL
ncbi:MULTISPECIES: Xaa-Pro peptidase family protein [Thermoactinomyces]|uniref:Aminopeptidase P family protein n=1 Tax=Thermoactinomyces daqus TaxID=1329516 RepID=A0A7W2AHY5_9BACL|nr:MULTISPECIES: Xaa-Pro peptidase family protein [Thermoactinomyces]MBA4542685.1 aminopeptidase P family protein [Thermoactinomyces daqus]MBH8597335.1 aminopeptidase P family protein [Thermoactinomyces sp. CICC 10523]MBH8602896.1 aminopeptidase P family protein [Thermoactinomyces sp. CICC 10522]MBH8607256.1 aminopeptidase P family protein [Thermoactinomyces sp. CICC 10521]